jgi:hypothetical protein
VSEKIVRANGLDLWTESFPQSSDPPVVIIAGGDVPGDHVARRSL